MTPSVDSPSIDAVQSQEHWRKIGWVDTGSGPRPPAPGDTDEDAAGEYVFDAGEADKWQGFYERCLVHTKGEHARKPFILLPWQRDRYVRPFYGWRRVATGRRRYRRFWNRIARKNGKSTLLAGTALGALLIDGEASAEVYGCAADREQAGIIFREARQMRDLNEKIAKATIATKHALLFNDNGIFSTYRCLSADAATKHGLNPSAWVMDEVHAQPNADLYEVMATATGARAQPIEALATTAGHDTLSICYELDQVALRVLTGEMEVPDLLPLVYQADPEDDIADPATWLKANPSLDHTVGRDFLAKMAAEAKANPRAENTFKRLHLDLWTEQAVRWVPLAAWDACPSAPIDEAALAGRECFGGLDLAAIHDTIGWVLLFPPRTGAEPWIALFRCFLPDFEIAKRVERDRVPYTIWAQRNLLTLTPGKVANYDMIEAQMLADHRKFKIKKIGYDRWNSTDLVRRCTAKGLPMEPLGQGYASMSEPMKQVERIVTAGQLAHGKNPVARWQFGNVAAMEDDNKNIKPAKKQSRGRIDLIVALIEAMAMCGVPVERKVPGIAAIG